MVQQSIVVTRFKIMVKPHPVILVVSFLLFVAMLAFPVPSALLISFLLLLLLYMNDGFSHLHSALLMLRRMRWFLISILVIFCWLTPGAPIVQLEWAALNAWLPTIEGVSSGLLRVLALVLVIASVNLLLRSLSRDELLAAIYYLVHPLQLVGVSAERVALRMTLTFDALSTVQSVVSSHMPDSGRMPRRLDSIGRLAANVFHMVAERAGAEEQKNVVLGSLDRPPLLQWLLPLLLWGAFYVCGALWS